jgi:hypothetical protein
MRRQVYWFFTFTFLAVGLAVALHGFIKLRAARSSPAWSSVDGTIVSSFNSEEYSIEGTYTYKPIVEFLYEVEGREYSSDNLTYGRRKFPDQGFVDYIIQQHPVGGTIAVYYNPRRPGQAVLQPGDSSGLGVVVGTGIVIILFSIVPIVRGNRRDPMRL